MMYLSINSSDYSDYFADDTLQIIDQIQNKANTCSLELNTGMGTIPSENQEVLIYDWVEIVSLSSVTLEVKDALKSGKSLLDYGKIREDDYLWLGIGLSTKERVRVSSIAASTTAGQATITLTAAAVSSHSAGEKAGKLIFGGTITTIEKKNPLLLTDVYCETDLTDFTKIFDRKLLNDSWADVDARYIINDALNTTINYNRELDDMDYTDDAAVQAEWIESGDGINPTKYTTSYIQGTSAVSLDWTFSGGTATFSATPDSQDLSEFTGASSGTPTKGNLTFWYKRKSAAGLTTVGARVGSDVSNYRLVSFTPELDTEWHFKSLPLKGGTPTGTPVWTAADYLAFVLTETTSSGIIIDDVRITADGSFTMYNFEGTSVFDDARAAFKKPTVFIDSLAKSLEFFWYIDYEKDIHFFDQETNNAPFSLDATSDNYNDLNFNVDTSQLKNRQVVRGGVYTTSAFYTQVVEGDNATREWIMKSPFSGLTIKYDDGTSLDSCEAGTTTTNIKATAHGLVTDDYIVNRTRSNAVRQITRVDADNFTVEAVTAQTNGDSFSKFSVSKTVGVENLDAEASYDYLSNYTEKSIRASSQTATLISGYFLLFSYNEILPVRISVTDPTSVAAMKTAIGGDGIFDGAVITDESLTSQDAARGRAQAEISQYSNPIVTVTFKTNYEGLRSGQVIHVTDSNRGIDADYLIQKVKADYETGDFIRFNITCASTLFGIIEYFQSLSQSINDRFIDETETIDQIFEDLATLTLVDANQFTASEAVEESATITLAYSDTEVKRNMTTSPYKWEPDATDNRWNLAQWG